MRTDLKFSFHVAVGLSIAKNDDRNEGKCINRPHGEAKIIKKILDI